VSNCRESVQRLAADKSGRASKAGGSKPAKDVDTLALEEEIGVEGIELDDNATGSLMQ
jgi:hypothetical protein